MKKYVEEIIKLLLGVLLGLFVIFQFSSDNEILSFFRDDLNIQRFFEWNMESIGYLTLAIYVLLSVVFVLLITYMIRFFTNTRNLKKTAGFLNIFIQLFLGIPVTTIVYIFLDMLIQKLDWDVLFRIGLGAIAYAMLFESLCIFFEKAFYEKLQTGHKRCKLLVCTVINDTTYEETKVIVNKLTFNDCYSTMQNNKEQLAMRQFFKIVEMNWNNSKEVDSWRYYQNGDFIQKTDEELCKQLMVSEYSSQVQWQG